MTHRPHSCRCLNRQCRRRVVKSRHPDYYKRDCDRRCAFCGSYLYVDGHRTRKAEAERVRASGRLCRCTGDWPHRKGSIPWCEHYEQWQEDSLLTRILQHGQRGDGGGATDCPF